METGRLRGAGDDEGAIKNSRGRRARSARNR